MTIQKTGIVPVKEQTFFYEDDFKLTVFEKKIFTRHFHGKTLDEILFCALLIPNDLVFLASLLIITRGKVGLVFQNQTYIDQILQYLISSKIGWIRVFSAEEVSDDYDDDDNEICDGQ